MKLLGIDKLFHFQQQHADSKEPLNTWIALVRDANWKKNIDIREISASASFVGKRRVVFNIKGNKYRLDVKINYEQQIVLVIRIGVHADYDKWEF